MLIPFTEVVKHCDNIKGIIHLGGSELEEKFAYNLHGIDNIIWIEAQPELVKKYEKDNKVYQLLVYDQDNIELDLNITNNSQSSSILDFGTHAKNHPDVKFIDKIKLKTTRMDTFIKRENIDMTQFNLLNLDLQGIELKALKSFGNYLNNIDYVYCEVNTEEVYKGCDLLPDIDSYLGTFGFERVLTSLTKANWGDCLYCKKSS